MTIAVVIFQLTKLLCHAVTINQMHIWKSIEAEEELLRIDQVGMKLFSDYDQIMMKPWIHPHAVEPNIKPRPNYDRIP